MYPPLFALLFFLLAQLAPCFLLCFQYLVGHASALFELFWHLDTWLIARGHTLGELFCSGRSRDVWPSIGASVCKVAIFQAFLHQHCAMHHPPGTECWDLPDYFGWNRAT